MTLHTNSRTLVITRPSQLRAIGHRVRTNILQILEQQPVSAKRLSERMEMTHGKIGYHLKVLEREGLIEVVEERKVRALTEKMFAPTFDVLHVRVPGEKWDRLTFMFEQAAREAAPAAQQPFDEYARLYSVRMPRERAAEFAARLVALADEFAGVDAEEGQTFGFAGAVYRIDLPERRP
jgi:DNA-binding transcriptional ArsR family regulator